MEATQKNWADDFISNSTNLISYPLPRVPGNFVTDNLSNQLSFPRYEIFKVSDKQEIIAIVRFGENMCGHEKLVHGGAIATVFDDLFGWLFSYGPEKRFTASLTTNYKKPIPTGVDVYFHFVVEKIDGRKLYASAKAKTSPEGEIYAESSTLYITARST